MEIKYKLEEEDYLIMYLFDAEKNPLIKSQRKKGTVIGIIACVLILIYLYSYDHFMFYAFLIAARIVIVASILYLKKWRYKRMYRKYIRENFKNKIGAELEIRFEAEHQHLFIKDSSAETKINYSAFESIEEIRDYFYLKLKTGERVIFPKRSITNESEFLEEVEKFQSVYHLPFYKDLNWK